MLKIETYDFWTGNESENYFQPAISVTAADEQLIMTLQSFSGIGDTYGPVEYSLSNDEGKSWSTPMPIPALAHRIINSQTTEGVADVRPFFHPATNTLLVIGCNSFYGVKGNLCNGQGDAVEQYRQIPVYAIRDANGNWSERGELNHPFFAECVNWRVACTQIVMLPNGKLLIPIYYLSGNNYSSCTLLADYDGKTITVETIGGSISSTAGRGILEPSVINFNGKFYLTLRAEDNCGYVSVSNNGLDWEPHTPWCWDSGEPLEMSTTQQHWLTLGDKLYLLYTRKSDDNQDVMRWRAPIFVAEVDPIKICLIKATEQVVLPLRRKAGIPYLLGNFHVTNFTANRALISDAPIWYKVTKGATPADDYISEYESIVTVAEVNLSAIT
jgi:hypothetical protein